MASTLISLEELAIVRLEHRDCAAFSRKLIVSQSRQTLAGLPCFAVEILDSTPKVV